MTRSSDDNWLEAALARLPDARVAVFGDFCLDAYWLIDPDESEVAVETGLPIRHVREQRYSLGGAANVAANVADLGVAQVRAIAMVGDDVFGGLMRRMLHERGIDTSGLLDCQDDWQTMLYGKPHVRDEEQSRLDFGAFNVVRPRTADRLAQEVARAAEACAVVILNQQVPAGTSPDHVVELINDVIAAHPDCRFLVDSRHRAELYRGAWLKVNAHEAARMCGAPRELDERVPVADVRAHAARLFAQTGHPVFVTRGDRGILVADEDGTFEEPGIQILERIDPVGAGDTTVAAMAAVLASGGDARLAARLANVAASVTVRKLRITGTASPDELRAVGPAPDCVHSPELADDPQGARMIEGTRIELVRDLPPEPVFRHAVFDHDGTLSTLREGWERIMEPTMVRAILGPRYDDADEDLRRRVDDHVRDYIDQTTGVQTLVQMEGLAELVREYGLAAPEDVLDAHGYKAIYNEEILALVRRRLARLESGELEPADFQMAGARACLEQLKQRGVSIYLVSGTDTADVEAEARALGYADMFDGGIMDPTKVTRSALQNAVSIACLLLSTDCVITDRQESDDDAGMAGEM